VSLSPLAARKAAEIAGNVATVLAIELLAAARGLDFRMPLRPGKGVAAAYDFLRDRVPRCEVDTPLAPAIETLREIVLGPDLLAAVETAAGPLD
jgi:histidine ammonia-lyase